MHLTTYTSCLVKHGEQYTLYNELLASRFTCTLLNRQTRDVISRLGVRGRGCRAGKHVRERRERRHRSAVVFLQGKSRQSAKIVGRMTSPISCSQTAYDSPVALSSVVRQRTNLSRLVSSTLSLWRTSLQLFVDGLQTANSTSLRRSKRGTTTPQLHS